MKYSDIITITLQVGSSTAVCSVAPMVSPQPGDAVVVDSKWYEVVSAVGVNVTLQQPNTGAAYSGPALLIRFASSDAPPSLRLRAEYEMDKLLQKCGQELVHFLTH